MDLALASIPFKLPAPRPDDGLVEQAQSGSSIGAMAGTRKGSSGPASHRNAPGRSTAGAYPRAETARDRRPSIRDMIDRGIQHKVGRRDRGGPKRWALRTKKGAFNRGGQQAPIEFR